jgi:DNA repair exonuclease SbcCD nuclease subunit
MLSNNSADNMFRFLHSSDLHIGKRFGNIADEDLRGRLREARHGAIDRLAEQARSNGAAVILLAGDTFDTETPAPTIFAAITGRDGAG